MTNKGVVLVYPGFQNDAKKYQYNRIIEEFSKRSIDIDLLKVDDIIFEIDNNKANIQLKQYDFCIQLVKDKYIDALLNKNGIRSFNCYESINNCDDKMMAFTLLENEGINMPITISGSKNSGIEKIDDTLVTDRLKNYVEEKLGYPLIVKKSDSKNGRDVYKINNREELNDICLKLNGSNYLFQEYIEDNSGKDIRVIVVGGKVVGSFMRVNDNSFKSNVKLGGKPVPYEISKEYKETAEKVAKLLKMDYCSVDFFVTDPTKPIICEINPDPAFMSSEEIIGENIAGILVDYIIEKIYK